ncbi:MAG: NUDIX domain-containing protein [Gammaproteobacteria bacterium]|nr:NUDIX domain-containing protein [Gammaproteobacteria bacterium]
MSWKISVKVVIAFIHNIKNELLITQRALNTTYGGYWELPGGKVHDGEDYQGAVQRELKEELGIDITKSHLFEILNLEHEFILFDIKFDEQTIVLNAGQLNYQWKNIKDIEVSEFPPSNVLFFNAWKKYFLNSN